MDTILVGISGGSASGKTSLCKEIQRRLNTTCAVLEMDNFYKVLTSEELLNIRNHNFDHPNALDFDLIRQTLNILSQGQDAEIPVYDFKTHTRFTYKKKIKAHKIILYEGIFSLYDPEILKMIDLKIFIQSDDQLRLSRRVQRDTTDRGWSLDNVLEEYYKFVKPSYDEYVLPTMKYADIVVPHDSCYSEAIDLIVLNLINYLSL